MYIEKVTLRNFKCFGNAPVTISVAPDLTGFVGDNGAGKSSALEALKRLFSPLGSERQLRKSDVHFGPNEVGQNVYEREVSIDVVFGFSASSSIPYVFNDIFFDAEDNSLKVRVLLEAHYKKTESDEEDIDVKIYTVRTIDQVPFGPDDERKIPLKGRATQFAEMVYIPAHRDSHGVTRHALKNVLKRIERSANWTDETRNQSQEFAQQLENSLNGVPAISRVTSDLKNYWKKLHDGHYDANPIISVVATEFEQLIRDLTLRFEKSPHGGQRSLEELSEGQVSLLYFALSATLHNLIWKMQEAAPDPIDGFKPIDFTPAPLTIFALEEPENHLAPFYLPRLIKMLEELVETGSAQSFVTSHSTSVLTRIPPRNVRYFRNCRTSLTSTVKEIPLPEKESDEDKFLHQTILANPEIYFARLIIIGEGDSERIVIPRIAEILGVSLDPSFVAFVPIGGRHAKDFWKLATGLGIQCLTLLDFDMGRFQGGMGRIKNAATWLQEVGYQANPNAVPTNDTVDFNIAQQHLNGLRDQFGIYYSYPLDLDMMMINAFPNAYTAPTPYDPNTQPLTKAKIASMVFGESGQGNVELNRIGQGNTEEQLYIYKSLFKSNSKPTSHFEALSKIDPASMVALCPEPIRALIERAKICLNPAAPEAGGGI